MKNFFCAVSELRELSCGGLNKNAYGGSCICFIIRECHYLKGLERLECVVSLEEVHPYGVGFEV